MKNKRNIIILVMSLIILVFGSIVLINAKTWNINKLSANTDKLKTKVIAKNEESKESEESAQSKEETEESVMPKETNSVQAQNNTDRNNEVVNTTYVEETTPYYIATLKIPKIGLEKGLVPIDSPDNTLEKNVETIKESNYPDVTNGNLILAAHSGNMKVSFFRRLLELNVGDTASIIYNGRTYTYRVNNIYDIPKTGWAEIVRDSNRTTLTLITCRPGTDYQAIFICYLESVS